MAENKYRVSGSAYGYGNLFGSDKNGFDDDFMSQYVTNDNASYSQGMTTNPTSAPMTAPAPIPTTPQVNQLEMGGGSDPRGNANDISNKAITGQTSVGMYGGGAPGTDYDDPFGTGSMAHFEDARNAPTGYDAYEQAMDQAGADYAEEMRLRGITSETYSARTFPSSSQNQDFDMSYGGGSAMEATGGGVIDETYTPMWGKEKVDLDKFASYDTGKRFTNEQVAENLATDKRSRRDQWKQLVEKEYGSPTEGSPLGMSMDREMYLQGLEGPDYSGQSGMVSIDSMSDELSSIWNQDVDPMSIGENVAGSLTPSSMVDSVASEVAVPDKMLSPGQMLSKGFEKFDAVGEKIAKAAPAIQALTTIATGLQEQQQRGKVIQGLRGSVNTLSSSIGNLANEEAATEDAMFDEFTEENRRIGARRNLQLGSKLDSVRGSNINTGTVKRIKKEITDDMSTLTDLDLAKAADSYEDRKGRYTEQSRADRSKMNEQLKQLQAQLAEEEKASRMAPFSMIADVGIAAVSAANPLAGMALSAVKNKAMG